MRVEKGDGDDERKFMTNNGKHDGQNDLFHDWAFNVSFSHSRLS